jgi:hypothetical protein
LSLSAWFDQWQMVIELSEDGTTYVDVDDECGDERGR